MTDEEWYASLAERSKVFELIRKEEQRQNDTIELIASENFVSPLVRLATASCLTNKYAEGYPELRGKSDTGNRGRYYGGCRYVDELEQYCCDMWQEVFDTTYHVNVQPHSGSQANAAAYASVLSPGDKVLSMSLDQGGHLSHGSSVNFSGKLYRFSHYGVDENGWIDLDDLRSKLYEVSPKMVVVGASAYSRAIDYEAIYAIIHEYEESRREKVYMMVDMAHVAGLIAAGDHPSPFGLADIITTTTHKTLRGPRGGLIFCTRELAKQVDSAVFPETQGGSLEHIVAAKAVAAEEACTPAFNEYIHKVVKNCRAMCGEFIRLGYDVVTGGTDNHLFLLDFSKTHPNLTGRAVQEELDRHDITLNKNCVPNEKRSPSETSGVRIGTAAMTTKGYTAEDFIETAREIHEIIQTIS